MAIISVSLMTSPVSASSSSGQVISTEGGTKTAKETLDAAMKIARSKPALSTATDLVCLACIPVAGVASSPGVYVACGILIAKPIG